MVAARWLLLSGEPPPSPRTVRRDPRARAPGGNPKTCESDFHSVSAVRFEGIRNRFRPECACYVRRTRRSYTYTAAADAASGRRCTLYVCTENTDLRKNGESTKRNFRFGARCRFLKRVTLLRDFHELSWCLNVRRRPLRAVLRDTVNNASTRADQRCKLKIVLIRKYEQQSS